MKSNAGVVATEQISRQLMSEVHVCRGAHLSSPSFSTLRLGESHGSVPSGFLHEHMAAGQEITWLSQVACAQVVAQLMRVVQIEIKEFRPIPFHDRACGEQGVA